MGAVKCFYLIKRAVYFFHANNQLIMASLSVHSAMTTLSMGRVLKQQKPSTLRGATLTFESSSDGWVNFLALVSSLSVSAPLYASV